MRDKLLINKQDPRQLAVIEMNVRRYNDILEKSMRLRHAIEGVLFDDVMQARSLQFMRYLIVFMLRTASGSDYVPGKPFSYVLYMGYGPLRIS